MTLEGALNNLPNYININIKEIGISTDHLHVLFSVEDLKDINIGLLKQYLTYKLYEKHKSYLRTFFWYKNIVFSKGYYLSSVGRDFDIIKSYVKNQ